MSGIRRPYKVDVVLTIPARSLREADHFARLAVASLEKRAAISRVQSTTYPDVWCDQPDTLAPHDQDTGTVA